MAPVFFPCLLPLSLQLTPPPLSHFEGGLSLVPDLLWVPVSSESSCFPAKIHSLNTRETLFWKVQSQRFLSTAEASGPLICYLVSPKCTSFILFLDISVPDSTSTWPTFAKDEESLYSQEAV